MNAIAAAWTDTNGQNRSTAVTFDAGSATRPMVILLHGASGTAADMTDPSAGPHASELFDAHSPVPGLVDRGRHPYPNAGWWSLGALDAPATGRGWSRALADGGYGTAVYSQVDPTGQLANPVLELHAVVSALRAQLGGRGLAVVADSRGGLLVRRWLADLDPNAPDRADLRAIATLHTPHLGTGLATKANAVGSALRAAAAAVPAVGAAARSVAAEIDTPDLTEMAPGSTFLAQLTADETAKGIPGNVVMHTWGGTSPRFVRARNWAFTAESAVPQIVSVFPPNVTFHWTTVPQELIVLADGVPSLGQIAPELAAGMGDLLVTEPNTRLPWSTTHTTNPFSHADTLIHPVLQGQVMSMLASVSP